MGSTWINEMCTNKKTCKADDNGGNKIIETVMNCHEEAECKVQQGIRGCYCKQGYFGDGFTCKGKEYI